MADEQPEPVEAPAEESVAEDVYIVVSEQIVLDMLREAVKPGSDPDLLYAEFWANASVEQVIQMCDCEDECLCCVCDEDDDDCECECTCEVEEEEEDEEVSEAEAEGDGDE